MLCSDIAALFSSLPEDVRVLGIDFGERKMGLALSDTTRLIASPYAVYERRSMRQDLGELNAILKSNRVGAIVLGLPLQSSGSEGDMCSKVRSFADKLVRKTGVHVYLHDERYSTAMASRAAMEAGLRRKASQKIDDKVSAALILQQVLDMANGMGVNPGSS